MYFTLASSSGNYSTHCKCNASFDERVENRRSPLRALYSQTAEHSRIWRVSNKSNNGCTRCQHGKRSCNVAALWIRSESFPRAYSAPRRASLRVPRTCASAPTYALHMYGTGTCLPREHGIRGVTRCGFLVEFSADLPPRGEDRTGEFDRSNFRNFRGLPSGKQFC